MLALDEECDDLRRESEGAPKLGCCLAEAVKEEGGYCRMFSPDREDGTENAI